MLRNAFILRQVQEMWVEGAPFEAGHGKLGVATLLSCFQLAKGEGAHTGVEVKMQLGLRARLTGTQRRKLLGVSKEKFDLETRLVAPIKRLCIQIDIAAEQDRPPLRAGIHDEDYPEVTPKMGVVEDLVIEQGGVVSAWHTLKT